MGVRIGFVVGVRLGAALLAALPAAARSVSDATGRSLELPDTLERILPAGQPAAVLVYVLAPEKMLGWPRKPAGPGQAFLTPASRALPEIGTLLREGKVNAALLAETKPELIVDYGSLAPGYVETAKRVQAETGIPYLVFDGALERSPEVLRLLGPVLGAGPRAAELAAEAERILARARAPRSGPGALRVYYSRSEDGLGTATSTAHSTDVLRLLGLANVADGSAGDLPRVTREQVLAWRPDVVFAPNADYIKAFAAPEWADLPAVRQHRVYAAPRPPFGWIDEPPSVNRLLGLLWVGHVLFPGAYREDLRQEAKAFYRRFYQVEPSDAQLDRLLGGEATRQ